MTVGVVAAQFGIFGGAEVEGPDYARGIDIGGVVDPVMRARAHEDQLFARRFRELVRDGDATFGVRGGYGGCLVEEVREAENQDEGDASRPALKWLNCSSPFTLTSTKRQAIAAM